MKSCIECAKQYEDGVLCKGLVWSGTEWVDNESCWQPIGCLTIEDEQEEP
jgi:hypothetical protein